jgi:excinuclease UvrABC nuclease subunit
MLQSIPEVGPRRAQALLECFGSIEAVVCASIKSLAAVPGIGLPTARRIKWTLGAESQRAANDLK